MIGDHLRQPSDSVTPDLPPERPASPGYPFFDASYDTQMIMGLGKERLDCINLYCKYRIVGTLVE